MSVESDPVLQKKPAGNQDPGQEAMILNIQRLSTEDGPGIRTTVFFKGCPLSCEWCHNPESISRSPQLQWFDGRCLACGTCSQVCKHGAVALTEIGVQIEREICTGCGDCAAACPANALELLGTRMTVQDLLEEVMKDCTFYETSGGGVTVSGGEPTQQAGFLQVFLRELKAAGVHTALDTCGLCSWSVLERLMPFLDLILFDVKLLENTRHCKFTGQDNTLILDNLLRIRDVQRSHFPDLRLWIRTPLIPEATATLESITAIAGYLRDNLEEGLERWELCSFNNLCQSQYGRLGLSWRYAGVPLLEKETIAALEAAARKHGPPGITIQATGPSRLDR
ncbi:MAG: glycyl-radical enzyme activating protein [Anaerolineales bacterium]|nr:glycyl-radical enzyme activating protein [Anaerolineales bacterium]